MTDDDDTAEDPLGRWVGGDRVTAEIPTTDATVTGRVRGSTGYGRTRIVVDGADGEKDTEILLPTERILGPVDAGRP
jgi:hypothetical protein